MAVFTDLPNIFYFGLDYYKTRIIEFIERITEHIIKGKLVLSL